jgi:hypothetical protein
MSRSARSKTEKKEEEKKKKRGNKGGTCLALPVLGLTSYLLQMESGGSKARRGAAWMWPKEGWAVQHGARERREVSLVGITTGVHRGAGGTWGAKIALQIGHGCN